ncbi:tyrosine-type recombinase/integrase [Streptomyces sp. NPDC057575]|uniref:tyrosine-type recombinase/integrase n=1 Tax=unclassified Streptomyces TaxID=2593676 RepID=UPI0036BFF56A
MKPGVHSRGSTSLQIAPSKTDSERLLLVSPELADVLSTIIRRIRTADGAVPMVTAYDPYERVWNPPMPLLFQYRYVTEHRKVTAHTIRGIINGVLAGAGLTGPDGEPLRLQPHDIRRMFVTDVVSNGLPPHIAQVICGHRDINTTMGYKSIYPRKPSRPTGPSSPDAELPAQARNTALPARRNGRNSSVTSNAARSRSAPAEGPSVPPASTNTPASDAPCSGRTRTSGPDSSRSPRTSPHGSPRPNGKGGSVKSKD